nr:unnamed protein product [Digitaria exilis]
MPAWAEAALVLASPSPAAASSSSSSCGGVRPRAALESGRLFCKVLPRPPPLRSVHFLTYYGVLVAAGLVVKRGPYRCFLQGIGVVPGQSADVSMLTCWRQCCSPCLGSRTGRAAGASSPRQPCRRERPTPEVKKAPHRRSRPVLAPLSRACRHPVLVRAVAAAPNPPSSRRPRALGRRSRPEPPSSRLPLALGHHSRPLLNGGGARPHSSPAEEQVGGSTATMLVQGFPCSMRAKAGFQINNYRTRTFKIKAKTESGDGYTRLAPLRFESPSGQLLVQILQSHPHLLPATVDQQLENLQSEKDAQKEEALKVPQDLLYKRIAEVKEKERQNALEEIIYCWIIYKFMDNDISMTPALSPGGGPVRDISSLPNQKDKLQSIHSPDAFEMIQNHLNLIMGEKIAAPLDTVVEISNLNLGKLYAASIMYGYFLKRVDERFQLEKSMKTLPPNPKQQIVFENLKPNPFWDMESLVQITPDGEEISLDDEESNPNKLRSYVSQLDPDTLQRYATIRSKEAVSLIEKQTQSLFGRPDIKVLDDGSVNARDGKMITITFIELNHLVLEAVAFGSFLWQAESYVESKYHFVNS